MALWCDHIFIDAGSVISDRYLQQVIEATCSYYQAARFRGSRDAMTDGILHQVLERKARQRRGQERVVDSEFRS